MNATRDSRPSDDTSTMSKGYQHEEKSTLREWNRAIPQAGYIRIGALRYGIRVSSLNLSDYQQSNKSPSTVSSLIMSPSSDTKNVSAKAICDDGCCCCIGSTTNTKTRLPMIQSAKNRTTSPSSTSLHQPTNIGSKISVSSSNFKRETSPTVCCYNINSRSQSGRQSDQSTDGAESVASRSRVVVGRSFSGRSFLRDKIRRFENLPNNNHENIINRPTTTIRTEVATADVDPVKSVSESDRRIFDDKNSRLSSTLLINRDESKSNRKSDEQCSSKFVSDDINNNRVQELLRCPRESDTKSSLTVSRQLRDTKDINTRCCANGDDIKVTKVVIRRLAPIVVRKKPQVDEEGDPPQNPSCFEDNDFSYIDASSRSVSRSSSTSFASEDLGLCDEKVNQRRARIPKINRIKNCNYSQEFSVKTCANQNIYSWSDATDQLNKNLSEAKNGQHLSPNRFAPTIINQSSPEKLTTMDKSSRNTLKKFGFGRKSSSSASQSPDRKPQSSKTERLRELTEKLKGHKTGSFKINSSRSVSPPIPPPLPVQPIPPPRKPKRNSHDISASSSDDNLLSSESVGSQSNLQHIGKSKSVEPSSIFTRQLRSIQERFLRPNISASNLESMNRPKEYDDKKSDSKVVKDDDFFTKLTRPESRTIVGSYTQKSIPFRSASFSQADVTSGKYIKTDIEALKASLALSKSKTLDRSPSPKKKARETPEEPTENYPLMSELMFTIGPEESLDVNEANSKRNSDIETIAEEPMAESLAERHEELIRDKLAQINVVQANEMTLETLIEEEPHAMTIPAKIETNELQQATTCLIPIPVFECVDKEWSPLPEHGGEEFCHPISQDVLPQAKVMENTIEIRVNQELDNGKIIVAEAYDENLSEKLNEKALQSLDHNDNVISSEMSFEIPSNENIPEVELNSVAMQLDEITEKLRETIPVGEVCNVVKTQIPQSQEELVPQRSVDSAEELCISPEIQEVLETVAETLNEEHKFLTNAIGNANINIVSLICPDQDMSSSDRGTPSSSKVDLLKTGDSSPEPGSFDKSDSDFGETVRKRHSNDVNSGSEKSSPNASPNSNLEDKRKIDKSRRRKGIYIQWPAVERSQEIDSFDSTVAAEDAADMVKENESNATSQPINLSHKKLLRSHDLGFNFSEPVVTRQSDSMCSLEPYTPDSDYSSKPLLWPRNSRRQSLTYQSSDEKDDPLSASSPPLKPFRNLFLRSDSISDNESDRGSSRDRTNTTPTSANEQDLKRYSKRPLRGPYGQMLEAEMKKPTKVHYDGILEELSRSDSVKKSNCSLDSTGSRGSGFFSRVAKSRKGNGNLPVPIHQRTVSSPVPLIETTSPDSLPISHKRYPSSIDQRVTDTTDRLSFKHDNKKLSLDSHLSPKRTSSDTSDKHSKKNFSNEKLLAKRSLDEIRMPTTPADKAFVLNTPETPKNMAATPELLAELLKGSSEKLLNEQNHTRKHQSRNSASNNGMSLPTAIQNSLNSLDTRTHVVVELWNTEKSYVESLKTIVMKYMHPLKQAENSSLVELQTVDEIFFMVPSILHIHEKFLEELNKIVDQWDQTQCVGNPYFDVFSKPIVLETYTAFVNNWNKAKDAIRTTKSTKPGFAKFLETMAREHKGKLSLDNLLIKIIQKFPNYELMFQRLMKHTDAEHPDYSGCSSALKLVHDILVHLNCKEREALENGQREATLRELENGIDGVSDLVSNDRSFISFELVSMPSGQAGRKDRGFFLFNDLLVITSIKKRSGTYRKPTSATGSFSSTLETNKLQYKFLTKIPLDDLEIVKTKDENVRRIMKEIESLSEDNGKLQQMLEIASALRTTQQALEDFIRDAQLNIQRQLTERQASDAQLNVLELSLNAQSGTQHMTVVFSKPEKRSQWEEAFTEAKQKLTALIERFQVPEFIAPVPIRKTRAGLQFTCASPTLGAQKDVWVCNSDGYVGQVCVLSLNQPEPTVTSCNGVCNARILCVTSVPGFSEASESGSNNFNTSISLSNDETSRSSLLSISNSSTVSTKTMSAKSTQSDSNVQLDSSSSSDSEPDPAVERPVSPSTISNASQVTPCEESESQMWLGTEDGFIHVYNCTDNIRIKKNKIKIQHMSAVSSILYLDNRIFVSLASGDICVYTRENSCWNTQSPIVLTMGSVTSPVTKLLNVYGKLWCSIQGVIRILNTTTLQVESHVEVSNDAKPISNMALLGQFVWISLQNSAKILCCNVKNLKTVCEVNLTAAVNKMLSNCNDIIQQHKAACLRVTSLLACKDIIWVGTSAGVLLTILAQNIGKGSPVVTGIPQGHTGHVRFLTSVEIDGNAPLKRHTKNCETTNSDTNFMLIISGGDGYEDFRTTGTNPMNEHNVNAGREDSTNHLLMWKQPL